MWDKIQELKHTDEFAASILYIKYKKLASELPPALPIQIIEKPKWYENIFYLHVPWF